MAYNGSHNQEEKVLKPVISWHHSIRTSLFNKGLVGLSSLLRKDFSAGRPLKTQLVTTIRN